MEIRIIKLASRRLFLMALCLLVLFASGTSCSRAKTSVKKDKILIGFSIATATFIIERWNKDIKIFTGAARDLGADVLVQLSAGGTKEQIAQINFLLASDIDVLVVVAHDTDMLSGVVKKAKDAKIPVIAYDRLIMGVPIDAYVSFNNKQVGKLFGKTLLEAVPKGNYVIVNGSVHDNNSFEVNSGLHEELDPAINRKDVHVERNSGSISGVPTRPWKSSARCWSEPATSTQFPARMIRLQALPFSFCPNIVSPARSRWSVRTRISALVRR